MSIALLLTLGALSIQPGLPARGQESSGDDTAGLSLGVPVRYESADGSESLTLTVEEVIDPYQSGLTAYDQDRLAAETKRYVGVRLMVANDAPELYSYFSSWSISLLDADTVIHEQTSIQRDVAADPELPAGEITAGGSIEGLIFYELPEAAEVERIQFAPSPDRLITLSSRGGQPDAAASATGEPTMTATEAATAEGEAPRAIQPGATASATEEPDATDVEAPTAIQPDLTDLDSRGSYDSAYLGHRVHWDPAYWRAVEAYGQPDHDHLSLEGDVVTISIDGLRDLDGDAHRCLVEQVHGDLDEIVGFDAPPDDVEPPTEDGRLPADAGLYVLTTDEDGYPREMVRYVECRTLLAGKAVLRIIITSPARYWAIDRGLAAEVLSAVELPDQAPAIVAPEVPDDVPVPSAPPEVAPLGCGALLTLDDADIALAALERFRSRLGGDLLSFGGSEVCTTRIASDEAMFVRVEPGDPSDFESGAELLGVEGRPIPGIGDTALVFRDVDGDAAVGTSILAVGEHRDVGDLIFRVTLGRPDLDSPARSLILAKLAREVLPRFPGTPVPATPGRPMRLTEALAAEAPDLSNQSFVANLLAKEEAGEWTRGEGLVATLRYLAGEVDASDVLRHQDNLGWEGTGILRMATDYLEHGPDDEAKDEIERLVDLLVWTSTELEAMAGISTPDAVALFRPVAAGITTAGPIAPLQRTALGTMEAIEEACPTFFGRLIDASYPCLEWRTVEAPPGSDGTYRVFVPSPIDPDSGSTPGGWTVDDFEAAVEAVGRSAAWLETTGRSLVKSVGGPGRMLDVDVVFTLRWHPKAAASVHAEGHGDCSVALYAGMQEWPEAQFRQIIAHELAHCFQHANFWPQIDGVGSWLWWGEGTAEYLSNVIYPKVDNEWSNEGRALEMLGKKVSLLDLSYATFLFWQYLGNERGDADIFRLLLGMPTSSGRADQAERLAAFPDMARIFQSFLEAVEDGTVKDTESGRSNANPVEPPEWTIDMTSEGQVVPFILEPFQGARVRIHVSDCHVADFEVDQDKGRERARPLIGDGGWADLPTRLPEESDDRTRLWLASATENAEVKIAVADVDEDDDPECQDEDGSAPAPVMPCDWCGASGYYFSDLLRDVAGSR